MKASSRKRYFVLRETTFEAIKEKVDATGDAIEYYVEGGTTMTLSNYATGYSTRSMGEGRRILIGPKPGARVLAQVSATVPMWGEDPIDMGPDL